MNKTSFRRFLFLPIRWVRSRIRQWTHKKPFGLKAKIIFLILLNVTGVLFLSTYLDYHFTKKGQIDLFLDRNLYIAKQIEVAIPDQKIMDNLSSIQAEVEEWLLSRTSLMEIDLFLFTPKGWEPIFSNSKLDVSRLTSTLSNEQIRRLKKDRYVSSLHEEEGWMEVIVPLHSRKKITGGVRVVSTLDEAQSYLRKKRDRAIILTFSGILLILATVTLLFGKLVGTPIQKIVQAMARAEKGDLEAEAQIRTQDELGELGRHFNRMLKTIRETHGQNVQLLSRVNQFNEELRRKIEAATSELARRNEELRLLNNALFESQRQLSQSEKLAALGQLTATMAHQIGTPLNSISGYIQLMLQEETLPPIHHDRLKIIESQLDRLADSVKSVLSSTRQPKPQLKPLDLNAILLELIHLSEPWVHARAVKLLPSFSADLHPVLGDPTHLQTLFLNLITNALDAMPGGGQLKIQTQEVMAQSPSEYGNWLKISITDTGIGITEESKKRIFDPFFTTKKVGEGSGLGLTICEEIVKEHFGRLEIKSEVGKGSTFFIFFPVLQGSENDGQGISSSFGSR